MSTLDDASLAIDSGMVVCTDRSGVAVPTVEEVRAIAAIPDPILRNLEITYCYWRFSTAAPADRHSLIYWLTAPPIKLLTAANMFAPRKANPHNIDYFFEVVRDTGVSAFSKEALEWRKRHGPANGEEWIRDYMKRVRVPTAADVNRLHQLSKRQGPTYQTQYAGVRNLHVVAHNVLVDADARTMMFHKTRIRDFEKRA